MCAVSSPAVADDFFRQQTYEIGIPGEAGIEIRENAQGGGGPAKVIVLFQHQHAQPGACKIAGGDETIVARAKNHHVIFGLECHAVVSDERLD